MLNPILKEIRLVNLTKYLSEVADVISEAKFKMADIPDIITVCTMLHERYRDFSVLLGDGFAKTLGSNDTVSFPVTSLLRYTFDNGQGCSIVGYWFCSTFTAN